MIFTFLCCFNVNHEFGRIYNVSNDCLVIENCFFKDLSHSGSGGAVFVDRTSAEVVAKNSVVSNCCSTAAWGGGFFLNVLSSRVSYCCAFWCFTPNPTNVYLNLGQFYYSMVQTNENNSLNFVSILRCAPIMDGKNKGSPFCLQYGIHTCKSVNSSQNLNGIRSGAFFYDCSSSWVSHTNLCCNNASYRETIVFINGNNDVKYTNIINNTQADDSAGIVRNFQNPYTLLSFCNLINNHFYLFSGENGKLIVKNCAIYGSYRTASASLVDCIQTITSLSIQHYSTYKCHANSAIFSKTRRKSIIRDKYFVVFSLVPAII